MSILQSEQVLLISFDFAGYLYTSVQIGEEALNFDDLQIFSCSTTVSVLVSCAGYILPAQILSLFGYPQWSDCDNGINCTNAPRSHLFCFTAQCIFFHGPKLL